MFTKEELKCQELTQIQKIGWGFLPWTTLDVWLLRIPLDAFCFNGLCLYPLFFFNQRSKGLEAKRSFLKVLLFIFWQNYIKNPDEPTVSEEGKQASNTIKDYVHRSGCVFRISVFYGYKKLTEKRSAGGTLCCFKQRLVPLRCTLGLLCLLRHVPFLGHLRKCRGRIQFSGNHLRFF